MLPVALDLARISSQKIVAKRADNPVDGLGIRPARRLTKPDLTLFSGDTHEMRATKKERLDLCDLQDAHVLSIISGEKRLAAILRLGLAGCSLGLPRHFDPTCCASVPVGPMAGHPHQ
jgi:hypothetical protein